MSNDEFGQTFLKIWIARMMEGESQIAETIKWDRETKANVPHFQALTAAEGILLLILGLGLFGWSVAWLLKWDITAGDVLLVGTGALTLLVALSAIASTVLRSESKPVAWAFGGFFLLLLAVGVAAALTSARERFDFWHAAALALVPVLMIPGAALTYRQLIDLLDPFGKTSPMERMMRDYLPRLFGEGTGPQRLSVPYRVNGELRPAHVDDGEQPGTVLHVAPQDANLADFIREAGRRGLGRRKWLMKGRENYVLPSTKTEVGRDIYDDLIEQAEQWGFVTPGGGGSRANWLVSPKAALARLEAEMVAQLREGE